MKKKLNKSQAEYFKKHNVNPGRLHEFRTNDVDNLKIGLHIDASVFEAGQKADCVYLIIDGTVGIYLPTNNTTTPDFILSENEIFGEMGIINNTLRTAKAVTISESNLVKINKDEFDKKLSSCDPFILGLIRVLVSRLSDMIKKQ